ncbi:MAG TPA: hypothetical protein VJ984_12895, partial [Xanthomonadales bacterium]|nr:hypothetical protein [Xanthomonadales bacterium]
DQVIRGGSLSQPVRDAVLFNFTIGLADFDEIDTEIIDQLRTVEPMVWVSHEERADVGVPLFNIAGAAEGIYQLQARRSAVDMAKARLGESPRAWVEAFLGADSAQRKGFVDSLADASSTELEGVKNQSLQQLAAASEQLTPVAGKSALLLGDVEALQQVIQDGSGADLARIIEAAGATLSSQDAFALLEHAVAHASAVNASLAISQLFKSVETMPEANELLFSKLGDAELGSTAALTLAGIDSMDIRARLQELAQENEGLAPARARLALEMASTRAGAER